MKPQEARLRFLKRLESAGLSLDTLTLAVGIEAMLSHYADERAEGCLLDEDGDILLFQWGAYDWGNGLAFEVSVVRQFIMISEDEEPQQLDLLFRFKPEAGVSAGEENRWCESLDRLPEFRQCIQESAVIKAIGHLTPESIELRYGRT